MSVVYLSLASALPCSLKGGVPEVVCASVCVRGINISNGDKEHLFAHMLMELKQGKMEVVNQRRSTMGM